MMSMTANKEQIGGDHYKTGGPEFWDLFGPESLMFYAGRYVARWRKKNGVEDLRKADHVVRKLKEVVGSQLRSSFNFSAMADIAMFNTWAPNADITWVEKQIITNIMYWQSKQNFVTALEGIAYLIETATADDLVAEEVKQGPIDLLSWPELPKSYPSGLTPVVDGSQPFVVPTDTPKRRVPRMDGVKHMDNPNWPWYVTKGGYASVFAGRIHIAARFYRAMGLEGFILEDSVMSDQLPRELQDCYHMQNYRWTLAIERVPADLRAQYPYLKPDRNHDEYQSGPDWQRPLYDWDVHLNKYVLKNMAWAKPDEEVIAE